MCDVLLVKPCHIILGRPWIWDRDAHLAGHANTYSFVKANKKCILTCARDGQNGKLTLIFKHYNQQATFSNYIFYQHLESKRLDLGPINRVLKTRFSWVDHVWYSIFST